jgi:hypothetical protein
MDIEILMKSDLGKGKVFKKYSKRIFPSSILDYSPPAFSPLIAAALSCDKHHLPGIHPKNLIKTGQNFP